MPLEELLLSALLQVLFDRLTSRELLQFALQEGLSSNLKNLENKLKMIEAVLFEAEEKQLTDRAVKLWLDNLRDLASDAKDVLDEIATKASQRKLMKERHRNTIKVWNLIFSFFISWSPSAVKFNFRMRSKIKGINSSLEELCKQRINLGLQLVAGKSSANALPQRPPSTSVPSEAVVYGRDGDKAKILEMLLRDEPSDANFRVIPIVGMEGIGKTTLAQEVYNDKAMEDFNPKAWVCVSSNLDVLRISKAILESITLSSCDFSELNLVQIKLKEAMTGKRFLIVLDDVWRKDYSLWETLKLPFTAGAKGSRIMVTTRLAEADFWLHKTQQKLLSDDDCWSIFVRHAYESKDIATYHNIELIRQKVVQLCKGLPWAAKTVGSFLHSKQREEEWLDILNTKVWELSDEKEAFKLNYLKNGR
ncbi:hypothetical protein Dsin_012755 [Dipteronia sinensis]|uniref:Disease resistance RPP13-like protein 1 n=1 Tax=Dipteronia sinensis TaxID=43782 RepID=A0AAE0E9R5_9ROSI|nr:hypothetical protein Dsin_012755 [Dipteronia sinensis]